MRLDNQFTVGVPVGQAWAVLTDLELIAPCMPGAQLTGVTDGVYTGKVKVKVGPVTAEYAGTARFAEKDDASYRAVIDARGRDARGQGNATAMISAQLRSDGASTMVTVATDLAIAGRIAQFGSGMIKEVSARLLGQFVECLEARLGDARPALPDGTGTASGGEPQQLIPAVAPAGQPPSASGPPTASASGPLLTPGTADPPASGGGDAGLAGVLVAGPEPEPLDLMSVAGRAVYKRLLPIFVVVVILVALLIYLTTR